MFATVPIWVHGANGVLATVVFSIVLQVCLESRDMERQVVSRCVTRPVQLGCDMNVVVSYKGTL